MPRVFDNISASLLPAIRRTLDVSHRADFCVGYLSLRGWGAVADYIDRWAGGDDNCCRVLVGMQRLPEDELKDALRISAGAPLVDNQRALRLKNELADSLRQQLVIGIPSNQDESTLRQLARQLRAGKSVVRLHLRHPLHAKLYLLFRDDFNNPISGYLGSSNLTMAGLSKQGELNVDVLEHDACKKLEAWFNDRWDDRWTLDISAELAEIIETSWAREDAILPYHIYLKIAYHLSQEARTGLSEFRIPRDFGNRLFDFQVAAVKIAAHHVNKRGGVLIGDVVGLGKTLMATAVARILEDDHFTETLILCPKNLVEMWEDYVYKYRLHARVLSISQVTRQLPELRRYRVVIIDESHNLRNRQGKRYQAIHEYIEQNDSRCILLSATPYNKSFLDLSAQLRLFVPEDKDLGIRPDQQIRETGELAFRQAHQCQLPTLAAFEHSEHSDDWRELMRLFLIRRTRSFIRDNYAETDSDNGRKYLIFEDGTRSYFPDRVPRTVKININEKDPDDQFARLFADPVVSTVSSLRLPRYGLGNYVAPSPDNPPTPAEARQLLDLSRAGKRLMGFCRVNLFKRLESSGQSFLQSIERHILRNFVVLHAIEQGSDIPLGTQDTTYLDPRTHDEDDEEAPTLWDTEDEEDEEEEDDGQPAMAASGLRDESDFRDRAAAVYAEYRRGRRRRFKWLRPSLFVDVLADHLYEDAVALLKILKMAGDWNPAADAKLAALEELLREEHPDEKVLIFTQFADTVRYLARQLKNRKIGALEGVTGDSPNPTGSAWRFSPVSNEKRDTVPPSQELRVLVTTDVLSEGQNLQDAAIVVNYDLPWAIIRLVQRAGRVDRIGQTAEKILCYSFLPAEGIENIIGLRRRVRTRLRENAEVVGTDEAFFEDERSDQPFLDLYNEKAGILDGDGDSDGEVDLASYAYQIWKNATDADPSLRKMIADLPDVVYSTRSHKAAETQPEGVLVYVRGPEGEDSLGWYDRQGNAVTQSQRAILDMAACEPDTPPIPRDPEHHELVRKGVEQLAEQELQIGGQLGRPSGARFRTYERLKRYLGEVEGTLFASDSLKSAVDDIYRYPLRQAARDALNRQLRSGAADETLAELVCALRDEDRLTQNAGESERQEPRIICSLGLFEPSTGGD